MGDEQAATVSHGSEPCGEAQVRGVGADCLLEMYGLKDLERAGWARIGVVGAESVAAHSWGNCLLAVLFAPPELDRGHLLAMLVLHDLAEVRVGDLTPFDGVSREEKHRREAMALQAMLSERPDLMGLVEEYVSQASPEARFAHELDKLDMGLQAIRYAQGKGLDTQEFQKSAVGGLKSAELIRVLRLAQNPNA